MATVEEYQWIHDSLGDAACVTVVIGKDGPGVLLDFNADPSVTVSTDDAYGYEEDDEESPGSAGAYVSILDVPGAVIAIEYNGFQGSLPEVLTAVSTGGRAASMFWNVNEDNAFTCARDGELVASVDMYDAEDPDSLRLPDELGPLFASAGAEDADLHATGLAMVEQFTGIKLTPEHLASMDVAHPVVGER